MAQDDKHGHADEPKVQETVQKATDALQPQQIAKQISGAMQHDCVPAHTCWKWLDKGTCTGHDDGTCTWEHPAEWQCYDVLVRYTGVQGLSIYWI